MPRECEGCEIRPALSGPYLTRVLKILSDCAEASLRSLPRRHADAVQPVRLRRGDRRTDHPPRLVRGPGPAAMHGRTIVPHHDVAVAPGVHVAEPRRGRGI